MAPTSAPPGQRSKDFAYNRNCMVLYRPEGIPLHLPMKLLLTNDDGIAAPGLDALHSAAAALGERIVLAAAEAHSGCSHRVTTGDAIRVAGARPGWWVVHGTPADCVRLALHGLADDAGWVLAGINHGGNLGADVYHSGTVAAVREGV